MANKFRNEVEATLGDNVYKLRGTFEVLVEMEDRLGRSIPKVLEELGSNNLLLTDAKIIIEQGLKGACQSIESDQIEADMLSAGVKDLGVIIVGFLSAALWGGQSNTSKKTVAEPTKTTE